MSYCRWSKDSDVYVFEREEGWECCGCAFRPTRQGMVEHLIEHLDKGDKVPYSAIERLLEEIIDEQR